MGCCCGTQDGTQERVIQTQIQKAVLEQEQLQSEENQEGEPEVQIEKQEPISKKNKVSEGLIKIENSEGEEQKQEKKQPKKKTIRRDENYMRIMEYKSIKINQYILKPKSDDISNYYELILNITHFDLAFDVYCKGILVTESDQPFNLKPQTYLEASQNSNYDIFFKQDTYFSIDQSINSNRQSFDFLLEVQRTIKRKKEQIGFGTFQAKNQAESSSRNLNSPRRIQKKTKEKFQIEIISEMLEIMHVFDLELCPRFHQLLFFILFQQQMPELKAYFINLSEVYFLFDQKPSIDEFNISKIAIFYEYFDYSLQELQDYLIKEKKQLSHALYLKLFYDLLSILYNCYQQYMYRCNFTLKSIFYINKSKKFKLQAFARLQTLIRFTKIEDIKNLLMGTNEQKQKFFIKDFEKDLGAVCDIALLFKDANNSISNIKKIRRKKKNSDAHHQKYLLFASELIDGEQTDKLIYEVIRLKCQQISKDNFDYIMEELKTVLLTLEAQFIQETAIRDKKLEQKEEALLQNDSNVGGNPQDLEDGLENDNLFIFSFEIQAPKQTKKIKKQTELDLFNEVKYSSIMYFENFLKNCDNFLKVCTNESHKAYALILLSVGKTINIPSREQRIAEQTAILQEAAKVIGRIQLQLVQDSFNYYCLLSLICKTIDKPIQILNQLRSLIHQQNQIRKKWVRPKLSSLQISTGIIEMRKAIILDLLYIDHFLHKHLYQNATHLVQHIVTQQLKFNLKTYLLYARTLFVSGLLCEKMIQPVSAMLNLEVCRLMYDNYFPIKKLVFIDEETKQQVDIDNQENQKQYKQAFIKFENEASENVNILEFHLGIVYFSLSEKENALKCLRSVREMREKKFDLLSDEVLEVIIQILRIHIEQDENGSAMEICEDYKKKFNQAAKQQVFFKSRQIARLQLIMAAIYECNGMYVSSLKFYQRANKTFSQAKSNSYVRQLHISTKIRKLIEIIKDRGYRSRGLVEPQQFNLENLLGHLSERVKPYFNNQFVRVLENDGIVIYNQKLKRKYIQSNQYLRNLEFQKALRGYLKIHQEFKKSKVDECYGFALEKIGTVYLIQKNMKGSCANLTLAAELHERYLSFPFREIRILTCQMYILVGLAFEQKTKEVQNQISLIDDFIQSINDQLNWQVLSYKLTSNKFAILSNKLGRQSLYQLNDLQDKIVQFNKLKIKIGQNLNNEIALKDISQKYINEKFNQRSSKNLDIQNQRKSCLFGLFNLGNRRQAAKASIVSPIFDHSKLLSPTMKNSEAETKLKPKVQNWINQNSQEKSQKLPTVIIKQQPAQQPIQANTIKSPTSQLQASQQNLKNVKKTIEIPNSDTEYQKNSSKVKSSLPATALVSPALSPISIKSPTQYFSQDKKMNPFEKVKRKK